VRLRAFPLRDSAASGKKVSFPSDALDVPKRHHIVASVVAVGPDTALLEGIAQTLTGAGHHVFVSRDVPEALEQVRNEEPLVAIVQCEELANGAAAIKSVLASGGAILAFHCDGSEPDATALRFRRSTLAELSLPLERQRLLALIRYVEERAATTGRSTRVDNRDTFQQESPPA
jgi:DNA-binding NtrC family response regulator